MSPPYPPLPRRNDLAPTQLALRELMILTRCYCGPNEPGGTHPRLGHNCSFRRDVETLVAAVRRVLELCDEADTGNVVWKGYTDSDEVRATLLGVPVKAHSDEDPPWRDAQVAPTDEGSGGPQTG